ncbi:uncharacterized protein [Littorina saxatilis]|uniref:Ig-like domain-containing protein n=2 Tax=Littorina saxatilis TaxID=31220 RepID=A0AAN9AUL4_9CAEN
MWGLRKLALVIVMVLHMTSCVSEAARLLTCESFIYVERRDDPYIRCSADQTSTVEWTLLTKDGAALHLGTCYGPANCSSSYNASTLKFPHVGSFYIKLFKIGSELSGNLTCRETLVDGTVDSDTCELKIVRVKMFVLPEAREDGLVSFTRCYTSPYAPSTVTWTLTNSTGQTLDLGTCVDVGNCTSPLGPTVTVTKTKDYSNLRVEGVGRNFSGTWSCLYTYNGSTEADSRTLEVFTVPLVDNCHVEIREHNWAAILTCDVTNAFSTSEMYEFRVHQSFRATTDATLGNANDFITEERQSYSDSLTSYTDTNTGKLYNRGRMIYSWHLPPTPGIYYRFKVYTYYGFSDVRSFTVNERFNVTAPSKATHNCSDLGYIPETGVVPCVCTADFLGYPTGRLVWMLGNDTIATADYGAKEVTFPSGKVSREDDGKMVTCQLDWLQPMIAKLTDSVAYGPDNVSLQVAVSYEISNNIKVNVISDVIKVEPLRWSMVQWGGLCQGQQGFTCTLTPRSAAEVDGKTVTYRVTNAANNGHSAEASVVIRLSGRLGQTQEQSQSDQYRPATIGVGVALAVVSILFVALVIIMCRRRHPDGDSAYGATATGSETEDSTNL